jgi:hypothetical protein
MSTPAQATTKGKTLPVIFYYAQVMASDFRENPLAEVWRATLGNHKPETRA